MLMTVTPIQYFWNRRITQWIISRISSKISLSAVVSVVFVIAFLFKIQTFLAFSNALSSTLFVWTGIHSSAKHSFSFSDLANKNCGRTRAIKAIEVQKHVSMVRNVNRMTVQFFVEFLPVLFVVSVPALTMTSALKILNLLAPCTIQFQKQSSSIFFLRQYTCFYM